MTSPRWYVCMLGLGATMASAWHAPQVSSCYPLDEMSAVVAACAPLSRMAIAQQAPTADLTHEQRALLAVLRFRGDVARGETVVDRCTAVLHGGTMMAELVATVPSAGMIGSDPVDRSCAPLPEAKASHAVLRVDSLWREARRDSVFGYERVSVVVLVTTWMVGRAAHERFLVRPAGGNVLHYPWVVQEYERHAETVWHRAPPVPDTTEFHTAVLQQ